MAWRRLCTSFGESSNGLCAALALFAKRICTSYVDPQGLSAYTASCLIPLDKCPGVRPIGVGEVCRKIVGKVIMKYARPEIRRAVGPIPLCDGFESGCEAALHAMYDIFKDNNTEAMLFVDASNAFNQLDQKATLLNSRAVCPALAPSIINTYRIPSTLYVGGESIVSAEGTAQGDPLGLAIYAIGTQPLIQRLSGGAKQVWYADDSSAGARLDQLKEWWTEFLWLGPLYGYFLNNSKTKLLVKPEFLSRAEHVFEDAGVQICTDGGKHLGGTIGNEEFVRIFLQSKVDEWREEVEMLVTIAQTQPQAAYAAFTHGIVSKWNYVFHIMDFQASSTADLLQPLEATICLKLCRLCQANHHPTIFYAKCSPFHPSLEVWASSTPHQLLANSTTPG